MAKKKKTPDAGADFDAVAASRRWRVNTGRRLATLTPAARRDQLRRTREAFLAQRAKPKAA